MNAWLGFAMPSLAALCQAMQRNARAPMAQGENAMKETEFENLGSRIANYQAELSANISTISHGVARLEQWFMNLGAISVFVPFSGGSLAYARFAKNMRIGIKSDEYEGPWSDCPLMVLKVSAAEELPALIHKMAEETTSMLGSAKPIVEHVCGWLETNFGPEFLNPRPLGPFVLVPLCLGGLID